MTIHIVGLGPQNAELLPPETAGLFETASRVILRTRHHPAVEGLAGSDAFLACDDLYAESATTTDAARKAVELILEQADRHDVVFAVPGNPMTAEGAVPLLVEAALERRLALVVHPALAEPAGGATTPELEEDLRRLADLVRVVARLHAPDGCPWDREQTHVSLRHHLLEESYECLEAIDSGETEKIVEELGDVLLQVLMHAAVGERTGEFSLADVATRISEKLIHRHPHVFAGTKVESAEHAWKNWDTLKREEKPKGSILEGVPLSAPALASSQALQSRARRSGFDWPDIDGPLEKLAEEMGEFARAEGDGDREEEFGDILFVIANIADHLGIDAEQSLRGANGKFRRRFREVESIALERGLDLAELDLPALDRLWDEAKERLGGG